MDQVLRQSPGVIFLLFLLAINVQLSSGGDNNACVQRGKTWECTNIHYIPVLPPNTTDLLLVNFDVNNLTRHTLSNLTGLPLSVLEFKRLRCREISTDVFTDMIHLRTLTIKYLKSKVYKKMRKRLRNFFFSLKFTKITTLRLYGVYLRNLPIDLFEGLRNTSLHSLSLSYCRLKIFNGINISYLTRLRTLDLSLNDKLEIDDWGHLPILKNLNLSGIYIEQLPSFINRTLPGHFVYPELRNLTLSLSRDHSLNRRTFKGLLELTQLKIQAYDELLMASGTIGNNLPKLTNLSIIGTPALKLRLEDKAIISPSLRSLELRNISLQSFNKPLHCYNLTDLTLSHFKAENPHEMVRILPSLQRLRHLEASNSKLYAIPASVCKLTSLTRLNLYGNFIYSWRNKDCRQVMGNLKEFSLAFNSIRKINKTSFSEALLNNTQLKWDLSRNPYYCTCNLLWFRDWLKQTQQRIIGYPENYRCKLFFGGLKIRIQKYAMTLELCNNKSTTRILLLLGVTLGSLSLFIIICSVSAYVKRWSVRYWCYLLWARHRKYKCLDDNVEYIYDAFVCYSSSDINWVLNKLVPIIEEAKGFQLCLHERDFMAGLDVVDNIVESVRTSRKVILVLSPEFASSSWCKFEASLAEQRLLTENRDMLVPILLEDIPDHLQSKRLAILLKKKTYLEWTNNERGEELFWKRFADLLEGPSENVEI